MRATSRVVLAFALLCAAPLPAMAQADSELKKLFDEDQADRSPQGGKAIDWNATILRDEARQQRVKALIAADELKSGADYYHAAMVMQHSMEVDDHLRRYAQDARPAN